MYKEYSYKDVWFMNRDEKIKLARSIGLKVSKAHTDNEVMDLLFEKLELK